jgi:hypothetical protein
LPDFSWYNIPKRGENLPLNEPKQPLNIKWPKNRPSFHKIYQHLPWQDPPKCTQIIFFWFENKPSGNPGSMRQKTEKNNLMSSRVRRAIDLTCRQNNGGLTANQGCQILIWCNVPKRVK